MELLAFFILLTLFLFVFSFLCFKVASLSFKLRDLHRLVSGMINDGVSLEALQRAERYYEEHKDG